MDINNSLIALIRTFNQPKVMELTLPPNHMTTTPLIEDNSLVLCQPYPVTNSFTKRVSLLL